MEQRKAYCPECGRFISLYLMKNGYWAFRIHKRLTDGDQCIGSYEIAKED